jgi:hypothetical protein
MIKRVVMLESDSARIIKSHGADILLLEHSSTTDTNHSIDLTSIKLSEYIDAIERLRSWGPILSRNLARGDQYELILRDLAFQVIEWLRTIRQRNCEFAIFETAATHHLENVCFEVACDMAKIVKVFLAHSPFTYRLIPIIQHGDYKNRRRIKSKLNNWQLPINEINVSSTHWNQRVKINQKRENSFLHALGLITFKSGIKFLAKLRLGIMPKEIRRQELNIDDSQFSFLVLLSLVCRQYLALRYLRSIENEVGSAKLEHAEIGMSESIYIASHFQPESSSFPIGGKFGNQVDLICEIRRAFPNLKIFYKEHPHIDRYSVRGAISAVATARSRRYYRNLQSLGVIFLSSRISATEFNALTKNSLVVTISGRVAIERSLDGLRTIVVGQPWYKGMPGTISLEDFLSVSPNVPKIPFDSSGVQAWIMETHDGKTVSPGPWSIFQNVFSEEGFTDTDYYVDMVNLINQLKSASLEY